MFQSLIIPHAEITLTKLNEIIQIKSIAWPYCYEKQFEWIHDNLKNTDIHVLIYQEETLIAYLNLIDIEFKIDGNLKNGFGIGNVCALKIGKGWGKYLIKCTNTYLKDNNKIGLLFCKSQLVKFYSDNNWRLVRNEKLNCPFKNEVQSMVYNSPEDFNQLEYIGKPF